MTRRWMLSIITSIFEPFGFVATQTLKDKKILKDEIELLLVIIFVMWTVLFHSIQCIYWRWKRILSYHHLEYSKHKICIVENIGDEFNIYVCNEFWTWWKKEVYATLQSHQKSNCPKQNFQTGDVVLVPDDCTRNKWAAVKVITTYPDKKEVARRVQLQLDRSSD